MAYESLLNKFNEKKILKFRLYSIYYVIEQKDDRVEITTSYYEKRLHHFKSFEELMTYYTVYNEPLLNQMERMIMID